MECVVEFHGFRDENNKWIIKELAVVGLFFHFNVIFKSPYSKDCITCRKTRQSISWLEHNYHGIRWEDGFVPFKNSTVRELLKPFDVIYTKGLEKKQFLDQFHYNVREIEESTIFNSNVAYCCCFHKDNINKCALKNAEMYYKFLTQKEM